MLRSRIVPFIRTSRGFHYRSVIFQEKNSDTQSNHFKDEADISSIEEKTLFENVFEKIMKKQQLREKNHEEILSKISISSRKNASLNNVDDNKRLHIVFGQKNKKLNPQDKKLLEFYTDTTGKRHKIGESAKLTTDDIRKYPVSLVSDVLNLPKDELLKPDTSILGRFAVPTSDEIGKDVDIAIKQQTLKNLEEHQNFKNSLNIAMKPYLSISFEPIQSDYDALMYLQKLIKEYTLRDRKLDDDYSVQSQSILKNITDACKADPTKLPMPYKITIPNAIVGLLTSPEILLSIERKYTLVSYVYQECKKSQDISMYLNICNTDFYNILLQLSWDNFKEIHQLHQLITEMTINGVIGDIHTVQILDKIVKDLKYLNDSIIEYDASENPQEKEILTVGVVWCRENSIGLSKIEKYLYDLKERLI